MAILKKDVFQPRLGFGDAEIFTNFWCFVHNFGYRYARKSFKVSKDVDFGLVSKKILNHNNSPMGWGPGPGKGSQKHSHLWRSPENENLFFNLDYKTCWIRRGIDQLSSSIAWRVIGLQSSAWNVVFAGLKGLKMTLMFHCGVSQPSDAWLLTICSYVNGNYKVQNLKVKALLHFNENIFTCT